MLGVVYFIIHVHVMIWLQENRKSLQEKDLELSKLRNEISLMTVKLTNQKHTIDRLNAEVQEHKIKMANAGKL